MRKCRENVRYRTQKDTPEKRATHILSIAPR